MPWYLDPLLMSRIQFAFTISFHIIFPALSIGLAAYLAVLEALWLKTRNQHYKDLYLFWMKLFAVSFGIGVVSGVTMPFQFGTNWAPFTKQFANVVGPLMGYEVLTAFFLEASFLGIMLFGWGKVSEKMHFFSTCIVSFGTIVSAFWILSANSWMQTPQGFRIGEDGVFYPENWWEIIFNPSFPYRFFHMTIAAFLATACIVAGVSAWYLLKKKHVATAKTMFAMSMLMMVFVTPIQALIGDAHGLNTLEHQPRKVAAMEGHWETGANVPLYLFAKIDEEKETTTGISIPGGASWILTHGTTKEIKGLKEWPKEERPPVAIVFWSFRIMVGLGLAMMGIGLLAAIQFFRKKLYDSNLLLRLCVLMSPTGLIALLAGWFTTEVGRQPFTVYGHMRTDASLSPIDGMTVAVSMMMYLVSYTIVFGAAMYYSFKLIRKGPAIGKQEETFGTPNEPQASALFEAFPSLFAREKPRGRKKSKSKE